MKVLIAIGAVIAVAANIATLIGLALQIRQLRAAKKDPPPTTQIHIGPTIYQFPTVRSNGQGPTEVDGRQKSSSGEDTDEWLVILGFGVAAVAVFLVYVQLRTYILIALGLTVLISACAMVWRFMVMRRYSMVVDLGWRIGNIAEVLSMIAAGGLLLRISTRPTPFGSYTDVRQTLDESGFTGVLDKFSGQNLFFFVIYEALAAVYVLFVVYSLTIQGLGKVVAVREFVAGRPPSWVVRTFAPKSRVAVWLVPVVMLLAMVFAWYFSSLDGPPEFDLSP